MVKLFIEKAIQQTQELFFIPVTLHSLILGWEEKPAAGTRLNPGGPR